MGRERGGGRVSGRVNDSEKRRTWKLSFSPESRCRNEFKSKLIANPVKSNSLSRITKTLPLAPPPSSSLLTQPGAGTKTIIMYTHTLHALVYTLLGILYCTRSACVIVFRNRFHLQRRTRRSVGTPSGKIRRRCAKISERRRTHMLLTFPTIAAVHLFLAWVFRCVSLKRLKTSFSMPSVGCRTGYIGTMCITIVTYVKPSMR